MRDVCKSEVIAILALLLDDRLEVRVGVVADKGAERRGDEDNSTVASLSNDNTLSLMVTSDLLPILHRKKINQHLK